MSLGPNRVQDTILDDAGLVEKTLFRCEDQLGSLIGVTDSTGRKTDEYAYPDYGAPVRRNIRLDLPRVDIYSVEDIALTPFFYINLASASSPAADLQGRCITEASPEDANGNFWNVGTIVEVGTREVAPGVTKGYLKVLDGEKNMLDALANNETLGATVYTFHDKATYGSALQHTFGEWSHTPVNSGGTTGTTEFRDSAGDIKTFMKGWLLVPTAQELGYLEITNVDTSLDKVVVKGDADTLSGIGQRYWLVAPAGVNPETGAIETDPCKMGSPWLWAGYHYRAPIVGFSNPPGQSAGTYGAQPGLNKVGNYQCWNRIYEPNTGRWTTPDPAMSPWWNLPKGSSNPATSTDPTGLGEVDPETLVSKDDATNDWGVMLPNTKENLGIEVPPSLQNWGEKQGAFGQKWSLMPDGFKWAVFFKADEPKPNFKHVSTEYDFFEKYSGFEWCKFWECIVVTETNIHRRTTSGTITIASVWLYRITLKMVGGSNPHDPDDAEMVLWQDVLYRSEFQKKVSLVETVKTKYTVDVCDGEGLMEGEDWDPVEAAQRGKAFLKKAPAGDWNSKAGDGSVDGQDYSYTIERSWAPSK